MALVATELQLSCNFAFVGEPFLLQAFIITLREGVEAALIIGITLAYLNKIQRQDLRKSVFVALVSAFLASIGVAILLSRFQFSEDLFEGWVKIGRASCRERV